MPRIAGLTLLELVFAIAVAGTLIVVATPAFEAFVLNSRRTANVNAFVVAVQLARSEAAKRARTVVLCKSADSETCGGDDVRYDAGWIVFVDVDEKRPPQRSESEPLLYVHRPDGGMSIGSNRPYFEFRAFRRRSTNGTVTFCDRRGAAEARAVIVSYTGRPRAAAVDASGRALICPQPT
jgi:type IV fimbrial biogenesis protein FimT